MAEPKLPHELNITADLMNTVDWRRVLQVATKEVIRQLTLTRIEERLSGLGKAAADDAITSRAAEWTIQSKLMEIMGNGGAEVARNLDRWAR